MQGLPEIVRQDSETELMKPRARRTSTSSNSWQNMVRRNSKTFAPDKNALNPAEDDENSRRSSINFNLPSEPPTARRGSMRRPTLGGVTRRLSMMRRFSKAVPRPEPVEEKIELPPAPRFISLLSAEAQYSAMKCYEDLLYDRIVASSPEYSNVFERTPSPTQDLQMLCINDKAANESEANSDKEDDGYGSDTDSDSKASYIPITAFTKRSVSELKSADMKPKLPPLSKEKKLLMSYRFQCAFDILDALKLREGQLITSPRVQSAYFDPVRNFASWHHNWSKEFKIVNKRNIQSAIQ